jgi:hypothetical protein
MYNPRVLAPLSSFRASLPYCVLGIIQQMSILSWVKASGMDMDNGAYGFKDLFTGAEWHLETVDPYRDICHFCLPPIQRIDKTPVPLHCNPLGYSSASDILLPAFRCTAIIP